jgi:hypothetical protein
MLLRNSREKFYSSSQELRMEYSTDLLTLLELMMHQSQQLEFLTQVTTWKSSHSLAPPKQSL